MVAGLYLESRPSLARRSGSHAGIQDPLRIELPPELAGVEIEVVVLAAEQDRAGRGGGRLDEAARAGQLVAAHHLAPLADQREEHDRAVRLEARGVGAQ